MTTAPPRRQVAVIREERGDLACALKSARRPLPDLFSAELPRLSAIQPNLCDIDEKSAAAVTRFRL
ncbi:MAG: hypothetical protein WBF06_08340 [Candidatus Acidiferrales bacterium]